MMNNLPGPDKGLLDALFGGGSAQATPAQAQIKGESVSVEDFMRMLAGAQDQKTVPVGQFPVGQSKDELGQYSQMMQARPELQTANSESSQKTGKAVDARQTLEGEHPLVRSRTGDVDAREKSLEKSGEHEGLSALHTAQAAMVAMRPEQAPASVRELEAEVQQEQSQTQAKRPLRSDVKVESSKAAVANGIDKAIGPMGAVENVRDQRNAVNVAGTKEARKRATDVTSVMNERTLSKGEVGGGEKQAQHSALAKPFEVLESSDTRQTVPGFNPSKSKSTLLSSQEFLAGRGAILGVNRPDPRLVGNVRGKNDESRLEAAGEREAVVNPERESVSLALPHVSARPQQHADASVRVAQPHTTASVAPTQVDISNPFALASHVDRLMSQGGGSVRVRVMPENLGEVTISVQNRGKQLDVRFEAGSNEARKALLDGLAELRQVLAANRYEVGSLEVAHGATRAIESFGAGQMIAPAWSSSVGAPMTEYQQSMGGGFQDQSEGGSAWERYFAQQDANQHQNQGRKYSNYRRYQDQYELGA